MLFRRPTHASDDELSAHLDGQLDARLRDRVDAHLATCSICREALDGLRVVRSSLRGLPRASAPRSFALREAAVRPVQARAPAGLAAATPLLSGVTALALIAFLVVLSVDVAGAPSSSPSEVEVRLAAPAAPSAAEQKAAESTGGENYSAADQAATAAASTAEQLTFAPEIGGTQATVTVAPSSLARERTAAPPAVTPAAARGVSSGGSDTNLHVAEAALAAVALVAGGAAVVVMRRRGGP